MMEKEEFSDYGYVMRIGSGAQKSRNRTFLLLSAQKMTIGDCSDTFSVCP
jgi:hypothetical protein